MKRFFVTLFVLLVVVTSLCLSLSAVWVPDGVYQPGYYPYTLAITPPASSLSVQYILPYVVYWPNSATGAIDMFVGSRVTVAGSPDTGCVLTFYAVGTGSDAGVIRVDYGGNCTNTLYPEQVYFYADFVAASPGVDFFVFAGTAETNINAILTVPANRTNTPGGGSDPTPDPGTKYNIFASMRDTIIDYFFDGDASADTVEYNIATLISIICCIAIILLPFLACWGIVRLFVWR